MVSLRIVIVVVMTCSIITSNAQNTNCGCVPRGTCAAPSGNSDGTGVIDLRIVTNTGANPCPGGFDYCCLASGGNPPAQTQYQCGLRYSIQGSPPPALGQAPFGAYPWQAVLLGPGDLYLGSGVLIDANNVLTVAHKVTPYLNNFNSIRVRLGEWDAARANEPLPSQEFNIARITVHPAYNPGNLQNDVAMLRLASPVPLGRAANIGTACLPTGPMTGCRGWVSGWGRDAFAGSYQSVQKQVDVTIMDPNTCQANLRTTRLGPGFVLNANAFICAGGENGKDACTGDGGSPLVCEVNGRWFVPGLVDWGIGCADNGIPGVYVNVLNYIPWIQQQQQ